MFALKADDMAETRAQEMFSLNAPLAEFQQGGVPLALIVLSFLLLPVLLHLLLRQRGRRVRNEASPGRFEARAVLNTSERRLHQEIERLLPRLFPPRARLLAQVSMAEFLYTPDRQDFWTIGASRVDFLVVDADFRPICAIEYQGAGHYGATHQARHQAQARDWKKRRALRLAGVPLIEVPDRYDHRQLQDLLRDVTGRRPVVAA